MWAVSGQSWVIVAIVCMCRLLAFGQDPLQAVAGPRLHHQLLPDFVGAEHWNVNSTTGPSFMGPDAEVQVSHLRSCPSVCICVYVAAPVLAHSTGGGARCLDMLLAMASWQKCPANL